MATWQLHNERYIATIGGTQTTLYNRGFGDEQPEAQRVYSGKQHGLVYHFTPKIAQTDYKSDFMSNFVGNYFKNSFREMVSFFAKEDKISPEDLKDIISEIERGKDTE